MRTFGLGFPVTAYNPFEGDRGAALYASPAGDDDPHAIEYRRPRVVMAGLGFVADTFPAPGDGPMGLDAIVVLTKQDDPETLTDSLTWPLPAEYLATTFWVNVRSHLGGLELDSIDGPQRISVDADGVQVPTIDGSGVIVLATKRDAGGVLVWAIYTPSPNGAPPVSLKLTTAEDSGLVATLDYLPPGRDFRFELSGLTDGTTYTLQLIAIDVDGGETILSTQPFTADAAGPPAVSVSFDVDD